MYISSAAPIPMDMDSTSGASSNSSGQQKGGSDLEKLMDQKKWRRMISNRNSARRSRARKRKHLDDLMAQVAELRTENHQILTGLNATTKDFLGIESENAILRSQIAELSHRLQSLEEIASFLGGGFAAEYEAPDEYGTAELAGFGCEYWNCSSQPIAMARAGAPADPGFLY